MNKRTIGKAYEDKAASYLEEKGYQILEHNYHCYFGEVDLIASNDGYLVFVEVKYRADGRSGSPAEAVGPRKQRVICKVADHYRMKHQLRDTQPVRFDVVAIGAAGIELIPNAFTYIGSMW